MTRFGIILGGVALAAATAANAQLVGGFGGGLGGGAGGMIGGMAGGIGGVGGGVGAMGNVTGDATASLRNQQLHDAARAERLQVRALRAEQKAAQKAGRSGAVTGSLAGTAAAGSAGAAGTGNAALVDRSLAASGSGILAAPASLAGTAAHSGNRSLAASGSGILAAPASLAGTAALRGDRRLAASGSGILTASAPPPATTRLAERLHDRPFAVRAEATAAQHGLQRIGRSVRGVAVYVPAAVAVPRVYPVATGPAYVGGGGYYGGGYYGGFYGGEVYEGGVAPAPAPALDRQYEELQRDTAGSGVTVERRGRDLVMQLPGDITFAFDRADIRPRFVATLDAVARTIAAYRDTDVEVIGHTDAVGSDAYNFALSQRRGSAVADFLVSRDTDPERLIVEGMGKTEPVSSNATVEGRAANRRVEIVLHVQPA